MNDEIFTNMMHVKERIMEILDVLASGENEDAIFRLGRLDQFIDLVINKIECKDIWKE